MRKIKTFITAIILTVALTAVYGEEVRAYDQCSGTYKTYTSEMKKPVNVKESKLTSLSYVKKICKITDTYKSEDSCLYKLDNGKGALYITNNLKACTIIKDGKLYGRLVIELDNRRTVTYNWHDDECSVKGAKVTEEVNILLTLKAFERLTEFIDKFVLANLE